LSSADSDYDVRFLYVRPVELDCWEKDSVIHQKRPNQSGQLDDLFRATLAAA
jgi:predicted nucleotidyltransferase